MWKVGFKAGVAQPVLLNHSAELLRSIVFDAAGRARSVGQFFKGQIPVPCNQELSGS